MFPITTGGSGFNAALPNEQATLKLMTEIAGILEAGDIITLSGDLGAGKSTFARALIRYIAGDTTIEVPSPTFTLTQAYDLPRFPVVHADLYRLSGPSELAELGFEDLDPSTVMLIEWPDRAAGFLPPNRLDIGFTLAPQLGPTHRNARISGYGTFAARIERMTALNGFLAQAGFTEADRRRIQGDASTRSYERLRKDNQNYILMSSPRRTDGPPVRGGKPYSAIAHLAEDVAPFIAVANALNERGFSAPKILKADPIAGLIILEDLGTEGIVTGNPPSPIESRYEVALDVLVELHGQPVTDLLPVSPGVTYRMPSYDLDAFLIEAELLLDWYLPMLEVKVAPSRRDSFLKLWHDALRPVLNSPPTWVLRDYHSPNLMWLPARQGTARIGLLDFQDAVMGPAAYDVASLLHDARVDVPEMVEIALLSRYTKARRLADPSFDAPAFVQLYATLAAQRASKILGIFARLDRRDHKPQYLRHIPRIWGYLQRALAHPSLGPLKSWYDATVPKLKSL